MQWEDIRNEHDIEKGQRYDAPARQHRDITERIPARRAPDDERNRTSASEYGIGISRR
jgi:hypothetical protein